MDHNSFLNHYICDVVGIFSNLTYVVSIKPCNKIFCNYYYPHVTEKDTEIERDDTFCLNHGENYDRTRIQIKINSYSKLLSLYYII